MGKQIKHFMYVPWTGLGLYGGFRGNRWLKNRIKVFKQFVIPSLEAQTTKNFTVWCSWRQEEKYNQHVRDLITWLDTWSLQTGIRVVHTFHGCCFWDDKYDDQTARARLLTSLHGSIGELLDEVGECDEVLMTIQPSDDCYDRFTVESLQKIFESTDYQAVGYTRGYMMNYTTLEVSEYNPTTNPPFFTIKFPRDIFTDPLKHAEYTGPYKSHEYIGDKLKYATIDDDRGFLVGTHGENISTVYNHPFRGQIVDKGILNSFGLADVEPLKIKLSIRRAILRRLPHRVQRKLRYYVGERFWHRIYEWLRS